MSTYTFGPEIPVVPLQTPKRQSTRIEDTALLEACRENFISLLDIVRVVHLNRYGSKGFGNEAYARELRANLVLAQLKERLEVK